MQNLKIALPLVFFLNLCHQAHASAGIITAENDSIRKPYYRAWIFKNDGSTRFKGYVYQTTDSSVIVVKTLKLIEKQEIPVDQIRTISFRRFKNPGALILRIGGIGFLCGLIYGPTVDDEDDDSYIDLPAWANTLIIALDFFIFGLYIGSVLSFFRRTKKISGNLEIYGHKRAWIQRYTLTKN